MMFQMLYDVVRAPASTIIFSPDGRAFEVRELSVSQRQQAHAQLPVRDDWDAVSEGLSASEAQRDRAARGSEYEATAQGLGCMLDGTLCRYAVNPASVAVLMAGLGA